MKSWKLLVSETTAKRDRYKSSNDLENYIKTNASFCVLIHTLFCGCRAQQEIANFILKDFTDHSKFCIKIKLSGDFKTRKLINFKFTDRMSSFIFGEQNCEPFRIFLYNRPPNAIDRFFCIICLLHDSEIKFCWLLQSKLAPRCWQRQCKTKCGLWLQAVM